MGEPFEDTSAFASWLLGPGGATEAGWRDTPIPNAASGTFWLHLNRTSPSVARWLREESGIDPIFVDALLEHDPRPRALRSGDAILLILRSANVNPGAEPEDLVSVRIWAEPGRIIVLRNRRSVALEEFEADLSRPGGLWETGAVFAELVAVLVHAVEPVVEDVTEQMDRFENEVLRQAHQGLTPRLGVHRREVLELHRYILPQRDLLTRIDLDRPQWITKAERNTLREAANNSARYVEDLQSARDHAAVLQEELSARVAERLNHRLYIFAVLTSIFLPLTFFTGLLGSNVDGIPYAGESWAFAAVSGLCLLIAGVQLWLIRRFRLL